MKLLFVFSHRFYCDSKNQIWSSGQFPSSIWNRYLEHFDEVHVVGRVPIDDASLHSGWVLSSTEGVSFELLDSINSLSTLYRNYACIEKRLRKLVQESDAVIVRTSFMGLHAAQIADRLGKPWAIEVVGCSWDALWNYGNFQGKLIAPLAFLYTKKIVRRANFVLYVTNKFLQNRYPPASNSIVVSCSNVELLSENKAINIGCSDVSLLPILSENIIKKRLERIEIRHSKIVQFGLIGSLKTRYKGIQTVLSALHLIRSKFPFIRFRILGPGDISSWHREADALGVSDIVDFDGILPSGTPIFEWLDNIDIYLQPSFQEGLPRSLIEAMSRGCPALGSICGGIPELLDKDNLIKPGDAKHLSELMLKAAMDIEWQRTQAKKNFRVAEDYTSDVLNKKRSSFWKLFAASARQKNKCKN